MNNRFCWYLYSEKIDVVTIFGPAPYSTQDKYDYAYIYIAYACYVNVLLNKEASVEELSSDADLRRPECILMKNRCSLRMS